MFRIPLLVLTALYSNIFLYEFQKMWGFFQSPFHGQKHIWDQVPYGQMKRTGACQLQHIYRTGHMSPDLQLFGSHRPQEL